MTALEEVPQVVRRIAALEQQRDELQRSLNRETERRRQAEAGLRKSERVLAFLLQAISERFP